MQEATVANMLGIEDAQRAVALDFFIGLHKTAGVREEARTAVRALTNTNTLQTATKRPIVQQELATAKQTLTPMQKKAFIEGAGSQHRPLRPEGGGLRQQGGCEREGCGQGRCEDGGGGS